MISSLVIYIFMVFQTLSFLLTSPSIENYQQQKDLSQNLQIQLKYNGKGFGDNLISVFSQAITDSAIYYKGDSTTQSDYICNRMKQVKKGDWHIFLIQSLNISKITQISTGFSYWTENDTWAFWYNTTAYAKQVLHLAIYNGNTQKSTNKVSTKSTEKGTGVKSDTSKVIDSIVQSLNNAQQVAKYISKYDGQKWSVIAIPFSWSGAYPEAYSTLSVSDVYASYHGGVTFDSSNYSLILYV